MAQALTNSDQYVQQFAQFIESSPTPFHTVSVSAQQLAASGFQELYEADIWPAMHGGERFFVRRDGAFIAFALGNSVSATSAVRVLGCHTDSPSLQLKPIVNSSSFGLSQFGVEVYGGPLLSTWFDRDCAIAGRVIARDQSEHIVLTPPIARVASLAIHLDREANNQLIIDKQRHLQPVFASGQVDLAEVIAAAAGISPDEIAGFDLRLVDTQPPERIGVNRELFSSPRLDNLSSVFAGLTALVETEPAPNVIALCAAFDHEEIGSETRTGARGPFLETVLSRLRTSLGASNEESAIALHQSWCMSADAGHGVHPNYSDKHDPHVQPVLGGGPMLKVNATQRYATDGRGEALFGQCCAAAEVSSQVFVANNQVPSGSTIGPLTAARLGIQTVDIGAPLLSMHSIRELAHVSDLYALARVVSAFFANA